MIGFYFQIFDCNEKMILKDVLFLYVFDLQKWYYCDKVIEIFVYFDKMKEVELIVEKLYLIELYFK